MVGLASALRRQSKSAPQLANVSQDACSARQCSKLQSFVTELVANDWDCGPTEMIVGRPEGECCRAGAEFNHGLTRMYSSSKIIGGYTFLRLVDEGLASLDTKVGDVLDWFNTNEKRKKMTVRHLMSLTSGIVPPGLSDIAPDNGTNACPPNAAEDAACTQMTASGLADAEPGKVWRYSQVDFAILGEMAEKLTGLDGFHRVFRQYVAQPIGLNTFRCHWFGPFGIDFLNVAGGLRCHIEEFAQIMEAISAKTLLRNKTLFDEAERPHTLGMLRSPHYETEECTPAKVKEGCRDGVMPLMFGDANPNFVFYHYGLTQWVECATPNCDGGILRTSSAGLKGAYPWIERGGGVSGAAPHWGIAFRDQFVNGGFCGPLQWELLPVAEKIVGSRPDAQMTIRPRR